MLMSQFTHFLAMGGYGAYVWSAYAIGAVVLVGQVVVTLYKNINSQ